nr:MAG TPA: hypothetical protein [Caudoviricetes sp.]
MNIGSGEVPFSTNKRGQKSIKYRLVEHFVYVAKRFLVRIQRCSQAVVRRREA